MTFPKTLYTKNVSNEVIFLLVTHTTCFNIRFGRYGILISGSSSGQILDGLGIHVLGQVFGPQRGRNMLGFEHKIWRKATQLSDAYSSTHFCQPQQRLRPFKHSPCAEFDGSLKSLLANGWKVLPWSPMVKISSFTLSY
jgi:hypothetical protein